MSDKVRFRHGQPEKIGGWLAITSTPFVGVCRQLWQWSDLENDRYVALGTSSHLYILWSEGYYDITPVKNMDTSTGNVKPIGPLTNPFTTGAAGTTSMTINVPSSGAAVGDYIAVSGAVGPVDVYTTAQLNQQFVVQAISGNLLTITMPVPNVNGGVAGGGTSVTVNVLISPGLPDSVIGQGWGIPPWGGQMAANPAINVGWGQPFDPTQLNPIDATVNQLRLWDLDNFGEDLVANIRGGPIYYWHHGSGFSVPAINLNQKVTVGGTVFTPADVPSQASQILVSPNDRHLIAMGCPDVGSTTTDLLLVRWSNQEDAYTWTPLRTNSAGGQRLGAGSYIITGIRTTAAILIWTDLGLWSMTYIGLPYVFGFQEIAEGLSIVGPNAAVNIGSLGAVLWMDRGIFYSFTGQVQELPCTVKDYIFSNFNFLQSYKVCAGHNHAFSEVFWFYPSASSMENDRYVTYNYAEQVWSMGMLERTAWLDMGRSSYPVATDRVNSLIYYHEYGTDANGQPMAAFIDSADMDAGGGDHYLFLSRFIPDVMFRGTGQQSVGVTIYGRPAPLKPKETLTQIEVTPYTGLQQIRCRERQISFRIQSSSLGTGWRLGTIRADLQPDGRR
jgi:hypothetical protein